MAPAPLESLSHGCERANSQNNQEAKPKRAQDAAAVEAACWHQQVGEQLPSGTGSITRDATTTPPTYVIAVSWSSPEGGAASYVIRVQEADEG
jgi:hypothetical protein